MDVLTPLDVAFLRLESPAAPMHIASLAVFDAPVPSYDELVALVAGKLPVLPHYRQRVREVPLWLGRPVWCDAADLRLTDHVRHVVLDVPGTAGQLRTALARLLSRPLRRDRPLWELTLVEGLADGRWALLGKVHHCMVDGIAGLDVLGLLLDTQPDAPAPAPETWEPRPEPGPVGLLGRSLAGVPRPRAAVLRDVARDPWQALRVAGQEARGLASWASVGVPALPTSLSGRVAARRDWAWAAVPLAEVREARRAFGGTVNDVVLTLVAGGFRELLLGRGERPAARSLRSLVPVSVRDRHGDAVTGVSNHVSAVVAELPVHVADAVERLAAVRRELDRLKASGEVPFGELLTGAARYVPPVLLSAGLYGAFRFPQPWLTTVTTNVPGPRTPLWCLGRRMRELYPFVPIADRVRTGVAITSYDGVLTFGVTGDAEHVPDLDRLAKGVEAAMGELLTAARAR